MPTACAEYSVLALFSSAKIFVYHLPVDMRKSYEGLGGLVEQIFDQTVTANAYFAFFNRQKNRVKVLYWDGDGLVIWYKRLEKGTFSLPKDSDKPVSRREFLMLLEGITPKKIKHRYTLS